MFKGSDYLDPLLFFGFEVFEINYVTVYGQFGPSAEMSHEHFRANYSQIYLAPKCLGFTVS